MREEPGAERGPVNRGVAGEYVFAALAVGLTAALGFALRRHLNTIDMAMLFLLAVVVVASRARQGPSLLASVLGIAAFDFVFVPPAYTFSVQDSAYFVTFGVMLAVALVMSRLTARIREQAVEAEARARTAAMLSSFDRALGGAVGRDELVRISREHLGRAAGGEAMVQFEGDSPEPAESGPADPAARIAMAWARDHGELAGFGTARCGEADVLVVPLRSGVRSLGIAVVRPGDDGRPLPPPDQPLLAAVGERAAIALERAMLMARHETSRVEVEGERLRTALLSSLSHDLRTPLASMEGAASSLLQDGPALPEAVRRDLAETIVEESRRMTRLVANLLDMIRVEAGTLAVRKAWQPLEEALGVALLRLEDRLREHPVAVDLPPDLPLVPIDELLIEQVFINLLENAARYCPPGTPVTIEAECLDAGVVVSVTDRGPGIPAGTEEAIFAKFHRGTRGDDGAEAGGAGLGLTICRGIVTAHGGRIWAEPTPGGGATFRFLLPLEGPPIPEKRHAAWQS